MDEVQPLLGLLRFSSTRFLELEAANARIEELERQLADAVREAKGHREARQMLADDLVRALVGVGDMARDLRLRDALVAKRKGDDVCLYLYRIICENFTVRLF